MFLTILLFLSGISVSIVGASYSIMGLASLFAGAYWAVVSMGITLEIAKLVVVSWLYRNWNSSLLPEFVRAYLLSAVIMLMLITSIGIFGFLSKAHLDHVSTNGGNILQVRNVEKQIEIEKKSLDNAQKIIDQLDKALDKIIDKDADAGLTLRDKQKIERNKANNIITTSSKRISDLTNQKLTLDKNQIGIDKDVGPFKYVAELIYGDSYNGNLDKAVRFVIICLIFVFDPLAVIMLIAFNISLKTHGFLKEPIQIKEVNTPDKTPKKGDRDYEAFLKKIYRHELKGLNDDEIKVKLDQIYDWNEKNEKLDKKD